MSERRKSASHKKVRRDSRSSFITSARSPSSETDQYSIMEEINVQEPKDQKSYPFRWVVLPGEEVVLKLQFSAKFPGQFDQTLNFEIMGTWRRYQLFCRGLCSFPCISKDPKVVFRHYKKYLKPGEIIHKKYILNEKTFHFGPLLCGKTRDRYMEGKYLDNMETLKIRNIAPMESKVYFCFQH
uniref:Uncharacterized protein n=1 Tax=Callorhinchus milii TaxID=7868 RepID=A0A4W3GHA6_CALMI